MLGGHRFLDIVLHVSLGYTNGFEQTLRIIEFYLLLTRAKQMLDTTILVSVLGLSSAPSEGLGQIDMGGSCTSRFRDLIPRNAIG